MVWSHPSVGLEELVGHVGGFLDILILASGCQSDGNSVFWMPHSVRNALGWALYLEQVLEKIPQGEEGEASRKALDAALGNLLAATPLPHGIPQMSCSSLAHARRVLVSVVAQALNAENALVLAEVLETDEGAKGGLWDLVVDEMSQRCVASASVKSLQKALEIAGQMVTEEKQELAPEVTLWKTEPTFVRSADLDSLELGHLGAPICVISQWIRRSILYATSAETIHKLSGATMIFSASRVQWTNVLDTVQALPSRLGRHENCVEVAELCCLFLASSGWADLPEKLLRSSFRTSSPSTRGHKYYWLGNHSNQGKNSISVSHRVMGDIEDYLRILLGIDQKLWRKLPPVLVATAVVQCGLLENYVQHLLSEKEEASRACSSNCISQPCHHLADTAERIWCLLVQDKVYNIDVVEKLHSIFPWMTCAIGH